MAVSQEYMSNKVCQFIKQFPTECVSSCHNVYYHNVNQKHNEQALHASLLIMCDVIIFAILCDAMLYTLHLIVH